MTMAYIRPRKGKEIVHSLKPTLMVTLWMPVVMCASSSAFADWQYTKWGMTPTEVEQAAKSAGVILTPKEPALGKPKTTFFSASYSNGVFTFSANFVFTTGTDPRLRTISLTLDDPARCLEVKGALEGVYGVPYKDSPGRGSISVSNTEWQDLSGGNLVLWTKIGDNHCTIHYAVLRGAAAKGL